MGVSGLGFLGFRVSGFRGILLGFRVSGGDLAGLS